MVEGAVVLKFRVLEHSFVTIGAKYFTFFENFDRVYLQCNLRKVAKKDGHDMTGRKENILKNLKQIHFDTFLPELLF